MKICSILLAIFLTIDCSNINSSSKTVSVSNISPTPTANSLRASETPVAANENLFNRASAKESANKEDFLVKIVDDKPRNGQNIQIIVGGEVKWTIKTPSFEDVNDFAVDEAKSNDNGFEIVVEYGSRYKYFKTFYFEKKGENFYLTSIKIKSFDGANPAKWSEKMVKINPQVSLDNFEMEKYLSD